jgi:predicted nucleic acid-binding protein
LARRTPGLTVVVDASCVISEDVEREYRDLILRPKFDRFLPLARRKAFLDVVIATSVNMEISELVAECADPKDDKYLALAAVYPAMSEG